MNDLVKNARRLNDGLQAAISARFLNALPRILAVLLAATTLVSTLRIYVNGSNYLRVASQQELLRLCQSTSPDAPETNGKTVMEQEDDLGNNMGYEVSYSGTFTVGTVISAEGAILYPKTDTEKNSGFYSLLYGGEDSNRFRTVTEQYKDKLIRWNPITGLRKGLRNRTVRLTIVNNVQNKVYNFMEENGLDGSCCAYNPRTGEVMCLVSCNAEREIHRINENLCTARPASTFKVQLACLLEEQGVDTAKLRYTCTGSCKLSDGVVRCAGNTAHGTLDLSSALGLSCNCWFACAIEEHLSWKKAAEQLKELGYRVNGKGGITALGRLERTPSTITLGDKDEAQFSNIWSLLGEGTNDASPLDMLQLTAAVAGEGRSAAPVLVQGEESVTVECFRPETAKKIYKQWRKGFEKHYDRNKYGKLFTVAKTGTDQLDINGNEAFTLAGYSNELDCVFYIRINNVVTKNGKKKTKKLPVDVANKLLKTIQKEKEAERNEQ